MSALALSTLGACVLVLVLVLCGHVSSARAQDEGDPALRRAARTLAEEGIAAAREHRWVEARDAFARSIALFPSAVTRMNLAGAEAQTGELVAAAEDYRRFLREADDETRARHGAAVEAALAALEPRIPTWTVRATLAAGDALWLDGEQLRAAALDVPLPVDPGPHEIAVRRDERVIASARFDALEGEHGTTELDVPPPEPARVEDVAPRVLPAIEAAPIERAPVEVPPLEAPPPRDDTGLHIGLSVGASVLVLAAIAIGVGVALGSQSSPAIGPVGNVDPIIVF